MSAERPADMPERQPLLDFLDRNEDPVEGALIVARIIEPQARTSWAAGEIERIAASAAERGDAAPDTVVAELAELGFGGAAERYYELDNSRIDRVLRTRRGIPVSLGVVVMGVARALGLRAMGVNFPRHFLVTVGDALIDPFALRVTSEAECRAWLRANRVAEQDAFAVATPREVVLRMLNNARMLVQRAGDPALALALSDYQLLIVPDLYGLYVERADMWLALGARDMAVRELEHAVRRAPNETIASRLRERIGQSRGAPPVLN